MSIANRVAAKWCKQAGMPVHEFDATLAKTETVVRGMECKVKVRFVPKDDFKKLPPEDQQECLEAIRSMDKADFHLDSNGDIAEYTGSLPRGARSFASYFDVVLDENRGWEYDGGEVRTLGTKYDPRLY